MIRHLLTISLVISSAMAFAQRDSVDVWISKIDNSQLIGTCHYVWTLGVKSDAPAVKKLIAYGKPASEKLIRELENGARNIIAHFILSSIWGPLEIGASVGEGEVTYVVNGLRFVEMKSRFTVEEEEIERIQRYWRQRLAGR